MRHRIIGAATGLMVGSSLLAAISGITGWAAVYGRHTLKFKDRLALDTSELAAYSPRGRVLGADVSHRSAGLHDAARGFLVPHCTDT